MEKVAPSERFRDELDEVLAGVGGEEDPIETVGRLGARLILQQALEDEVSEFLGRRRYERCEETVSHRNGHEPKTVKTTSGAMRLQRPRIRDAGKLGFESRILGKGPARTHALESLVISSFLRDLSTRDVEAALEEVFEEPIASKSTVSRIWKATRELWPNALEQRCTVHALRNVTGKLPERHHQEVKARWWKAFDEARSPGEATRELQGIIADYR
jgi:putative transposase